MAKSTKAPVRRKAVPKAKKPRADFPLFPHQSGRWAKKVRQKFCYFGKVADDPKGEKALSLWLDQRDDLLAGRVPRSKVDTFTVEDLADHFLNAKRPLVTSGELAKRTFDEYFATCERLVKKFGLSRPVDDLRPSDFDELRADVAKQWGPVRLGNEIQRVRSVFKYGFEAGHIDRPVRFGPTFKRPNRKVLRVERAKKGARLFEARHIRRLLKAAGPQLRAMILLGINCGYGNHDCGTLPRSALDLARGWVDFPRPKTGMPRRCPLWPETVQALKVSITERPTPKDKALEHRVFITKYGLSWVKATEDNPVSKEFRKLLDSLGMHRPGLGFYCLRHGLETIGGEAKDQVAVNAIMGHVDESMAGVYRERISDERLQAVVNHVRRWLFRGRRQK